MSGAILNVSKKLADGTLIALGGTSAEDFLNNAAVLLGDDGVADLQAEIKQAFVPASAGATAQQQSNVVAGNFGGQQAAQQQTQQTQQADAGGGAVPLCPNHQQPGRFVSAGTTQAGKPYAAFWACAVSERGDRKCRFPR